MTVQPNYTPAVLRLARQIRAGVSELTTAELLALRDALADDYPLPPDIGTREPRQPKPTAPAGAIRRAKGHTT